MATELIEQATAAERLTRRAATIEEFWALPECLLHIEYIEGEIVMAPSPVPLHQSALGNIFVALSNYARGAGAGEIFISPLDVVLPSGDVVQPDAFLLTSEETERAMTQKRVYAAPSFLVEILSPGSITHDTLTKRRLYERNGVREYWIVDPEARAVAQLVLRRKHYELAELAAGDTIRGVVLAGFEMNVGELLGLAGGR